MKRHTQGLLAALALLIAWRFDARYTLFLATALLLLVGLPLGMSRYGFWKTYTAFLFVVTFFGTLMWLDGGDFATNWHSQLSNWALVAIVAAYTWGHMPRAAAVRIGSTLFVAGWVAWESFRYWGSYSVRIEIIIFSFVIMLPGFLALYRYALGQSAQRSRSAAS